MTELVKQDAMEAQVGAVANLPRDLAIVKMENENIMALAAAHPRDYGEVLADIKHQLQTFKSFAKSAVYSKPVGKGDGGKMKYARGLSVRAAEAVACSYQYNRVRTEVTPLDNDTARVDAVFTDFQSGRIWQKSSVVSKNYKRSSGGLGRHSDDRFFNVVCEAMGSKLLRECILRSVPPGLRSELMQCVDEQLDEFLDESTIQKLIASFSEKDIDQEQLETLIGKRTESFTKEDRRHLVGIWNSIEQGEATVAELFGEPASEPPAKTPAPGKLDQFMAAKGKGKGKGNGRRKRKAKPEPEKPSVPAGEQARQVEALKGQADPARAAQDAIIAAFAKVPQDERDPVIENLGMKDILEVRQVADPAELQSIRDALPA